MDYGETSTGSLGHLASWDMEEMENKLALQNSRRAVKCSQYSVLMQFFQVSNINFNRGEKLQIRCQGLGNFQQWQNKDVPYTGFKADSLHWV